MLLMCKDISVYDIDNEVVYNSNLLPGLMSKRPCRETFKTWLKSRYSTNTNSIARRLKGVTFGQGNRVSINKATHILSLSDCYWVKDNDSPLTFSMVSPYYNDFWKGEGIYSIGSNISVPTLYVGGYLSKEWISSKFLCKYGKDLDIEVDISTLCKACGISVCNISTIDGGVRIENFTNTDLMLEQADQSGFIDPDDFTETDIINLMGLHGVQMIIIDAIIGNGDRHAGNFGWLRSTNTGEYITPAPLYDFDHALDSKLSSDRLIQDAVSCVMENKYFDEALRICRIVLSLNTNPIFKLRANNIVKILNTM